ncbi:MAG: 1-deoxy-D-xylulose-5-phosphate reductoisomerase, partial [Actinomycetota bacterium]|nr:1-deoxy-D-xylulose-5-phosphate reductoisomerase [Actinomycetota bacterium]
YEAGRRGRTWPAVLNAANEIAVAAFLGGELPFPDIAEVIGKVVEEHEPAPETSLESVLAADAWARDAASELVAKRARTGV